MSLYNWMMVMVRGALGFSAKKLPWMMYSGLVASGGVMVILSNVVFLFFVLMMSRPSSCRTLPRRGMYSGMFLAEIVT